MFGNKMQCGCCNAPSPPCNGSLTVSVFQTCGGLLTGVTVTLQFGSTTLTRTSPNVGSNGYRFTSTTLSGWSDGTIGTVTVTQAGKAPVVRVVTLHCSATTLNVFLSPDSLKIRVGGCFPGSFIPATVAISGAGAGDGTYTTPSDGSFLEVPVTTDGTAITGDFSAYGFVPETLSLTPCGVNAIGLVVDADHTCCYCSDWPACLEMTLDCPQGTATLVYDPSIGGAKHYVGQITVGVTGKVATFDPATGRYFPACQGAAVDTVGVTFYYDFTCGQIAIAFNGCTDGTVPCVGGGSADPNDQYAMEDLGGIGGGYGYTGCDGVVIGASMGISSTRRFSSAITQDSCEPGGFAAHATLPGKYGGLFSITESCSGGRPAAAIDPEGGEHPMMARAPGLVQMAGNLARAVVEHVADGGRKAPPEVQAARKADCFACDQHDHGRDRCQSCGCVAMDLKRSWASSACPLPEPKWAAV